jgi:hypothetical protein
LGRTREIDPGRRDIEAQRLIDRQTMTDVPERILNRGGEEGDMPGPGRFFCWRCAQATKIGDRDDSRTIDLGAADRSGSCSVVRSPWCWYS